MDLELWFIAVGTLLIAMVFMSALLRRLSLTATIFYLLIGILLGNSGVLALPIESLRDTSLLRLLTEIAVIISLFTAGLKLRLPLRSIEWKTPFILATASMLITIAVVSGTAYFFLHFSFGASILLGSILAPTDPVLASSVQVLGPRDEDRLRFSLTAEAGLNDGTAYPFVMLGLGLLGLRDLGEWGIYWFAVDLIWGIVGGLTIGTCVAITVGKLIGILRATQKETSGYDDFLAVGLILLSYGTALLFNACGFLAVFAAGLALRRRERQETDLHKYKSDGEHSTSRLSRDSVSREMAKSLLFFNEQMERICELVVVIFLGALLSWSDFSIRSGVIVGTLILIARPLSVFLGVRAQGEKHRSLLAWFGIRGIGSLYYLAFAIEHGLAPELAKTLTEFTFSAVVLSILIHGLSSARLMVRHDRTPV